MSLATTALALYLRTKAQFHHLTAPATPQADHNHLTHPITLTFSLHPTGLPRRRPRRPMTTAIRRLLRPKAPPPPPPIHVAAPPVSAPPPAPPAPSPPCRLCAAAPA